MFSCKWYSTENGKPAKEHRWTETVPRFPGQHEWREIPQERIGENEGLPRRKESKKNTVVGVALDGVVACWVVVVGIVVVMGVVVLDSPDAKLQSPLTI